MLGTSEPKRQTNRGFGLTFAGLFAVIFAVALIVFDRRIDWVLAVAAIFAAFALAAPGVLLPLNRLWGWFASKLSVVNNHLLLGLFLYLILTPIGFFMRLIGGDPMAMRGKPQNSYWTSVSRGTNAETLRDLF